MLRSAAVDSGRQHLTCAGMSIPRCIRWCGRLAANDRQTRSGRAATADAGLIQSRELTLRSIYVGPLTMLHDVMQAFADHGMRPVIDRSFGFDDAPAAFDYLREARHVGKVVIEQ
jgi:NADPH:quinone reductase-like Zn-dependent oxidoreductase